MRDDRAGRFVRLASVGVIAWSVSLTARNLYLLIIQSWPHGYLWAVGATAVYLPLGIILVLRAIRNAPARSSGWLLAAVAAVILGMLPFGGPWWPPNVAILAGLALIFARPPWSVPLLAALVMAAVTAAFLWGRVPPGAGQAGSTYQYDGFDTVDILWSGIALAVLVWLARIVRELQAARQELAARALVVERQRIDDELARTLGTALERIIAGAAAASALARDDPQAAARELRALTGRSRTTLAEARAVLTGYRDVSLGAELRAASTLLTAAGIRTAVVLPDGELSQELPPGLRTRLRAAVTEALSDGTRGECILTITPAADGGLDIQLTTGPELAGKGAA
jgi:two-component system sensor histidine kinase DesK